MKKVVVEDQTRTEGRVQSDQKVEHLYNNNEETLQTQSKSVRKSNTVISLVSQQSRTIMDGRSVEGGVISHRVSAVE